ncbi:unnamed protein product [Victoria cruziana]
MSLNATSGEHSDLMFDGVHGGCGDIPVRNGELETVTKMFALQFCMPLIIINLLYLFLKRVGQPFFVAELMGALALSLVSHLPPFYDLSAESIRLLVDQTLPVLGFMIGLDMSFSSYWTTDLEAIGVCVGATLISTTITSITSFVYWSQTVKMPESLFISFFWGIVLSDVSSPVLIQVSTDLKLMRSRIGRLAVSSAQLNDLTMLLLLGFASTQAGIGRSTYHGPIGTIVFIVMVVALRGVIRQGVEWVNWRNPEGRPMKSAHLIAVALLEAAMVFLGQIVGANGLFTAFLLGLVFHKEGRLVREVKSRCNALCTYLILPVLMLDIGMSIELGSMNTLRSWGLLLLLITLIASGKLVGTMVACSRMGVPVDESAVMGFLLSVKGYVHVIVVERCLRREILTPPFFTRIILAILLTDMIAPMLVMMIVRKARRTNPASRMALQWLDSRLELRVLACVEDKRHVPSMVNLIEGLRGPAQSKLLVYAMHLVELPDDENTVLVYREDQQHMEVVMSTEALDQQNHIVSTFRSYGNHAGDGLILRPMVTASSLASMHEDICNAAEDIRATLLVLPFHRHQRVDGRMDLGNLGFQSVHRKVLCRSPCSIAILVDRGLGGTSLLSATQVSHQVAAVFLGGPDDREAMALATRLADHRGIGLSVVRFLPDSATAPPSRSSSMAPFNVGPDSAESFAETAKETEADEHCIAAFRERYVATGIATYVEKYVSNGIDTVTRLGELESMYSLFVVGRSGHTSLAVTSGMREWEETPELGTLGDVLASSDFSVTASVIIVQVHRIETETDNELM